MKKSTLLSLLSFTCLGLLSHGVGLVNYGYAANNKPDWVQDNASGQDISVSHDGARWFIGQDGKSYEWNIQKQSWFPRGSRSNFIRIDAGQNGAAALTDSGLLYVTGLRGEWQSTGIRAGDVGIGAGEIWLADAQVKNGNRATLKGNFDPTGKIEWTEIKGRLSRIDVDPQGRAWGVDASGALFVHTNADGWIQDELAPKASDIGVGGEGSLFIVGNDISAELGGGRVYQRNPINGEWSSIAGRLSAISVDVDGKPAGVNSKSWVITGTMQPNTNNDGTTKEKPKSDVTPLHATLRDLVGDKLDLPPSFENAFVEITNEGNNNITTGVMWLNGLETFITVIKHAGSDIPSLAFGHDKMRFGDYMPEADSTAFGEIGLFTLPTFFFVDQSNAHKKFSDADAKILQNNLLREDIPKNGFDAGLHLLGSVDISRLNGGAEFVKMLGLKSSDMGFTATLSPDLFLGVTPSMKKIVNAPDLSLEDIKAQYGGTALFDEAVIKIPLQFAGPDTKTKTIGPIALKNPVLEFSWGEDLEFAVNFDLATQVKMDAKKLDALNFNDVRAVFNPQEKSATLEGKIGTEQANALISQGGYKLTKAAFEGAFKITQGGNALPKTLNDFETFSFAVSGQGLAPTPNGKTPSTIDMLVSLEPDDAGQALIPTLIIESDMMLADITGNIVPGASKINLSQFKASTNYIEGTVRLDGSPVRAVLYTPDSGTPIIGLEHESLDLGTYIPPIRNTSLGSFGLGNAILFVQAEDAAEVIYATMDDVPKPLAVMLKEAKYTGMFPLTIHPGVTVIGTYSPAKDGNAAAVMAAYSIDENGYAVSGHFKLSQLKNVQFQKFDPRFSVNKKAVCEKVTNVTLSGLDLSFPLPNFKPSYSSGSIAFDNAAFSLKEIDGKIEPSIVTGMTLKMPEKVAGISNIPMATKLSVQTDLNVLCNGVTTQTEGTIAFAASTTLNASQVKGIAFDALARVTDEPKPKLKTDATAKTPIKTASDIGWKSPFGIPALTIRQYASSGIFEQAYVDGTLERTLKTRVWSDAKLDRADLDLYGSTDYVIKPDTLEIVDWSFKAPGPIALNNLPGLKDMPKVDEFTISDIDLTPEEMIGKLWRGSEKMEATAYLARQNKEGQADDFSMFVRFESLKPKMIYDFLPESMSDVTFAPALIGWRTDTTTLKYADASEKLKPLLHGLIKEDGELKAVTGLTIGGKTAPEKIFKGRFTDLFKDYVSLSGGLSLFGTFAKDNTGQIKGEMRADLDGLTINNIPESLLRLKNSALVLSNLNGNLIEIETTADVTFPEKKDSIEMTGSFKYEAPSETENSFDLTLKSAELWNNPFEIPDLQVSNAGLEASFKRNKEKTSHATGFFGDGVFRGQSGKVGISIAAANTGATDVVVSFDGSLKVSELMNLPAGASDIADAKIRKLLISTNAIAGVMDVNIGGLVLKDAKAAVIHDNGNAALFIRHDHDIEIGKMVAGIPSPLDQVSIPNGVLIISSQSVPDFNAGDIPDSIYDEVLGGLTDDELAQSLLVEDGLTFLTKMDVSKLPNPISGILASPFGVKDKVFMAGSVGGLFGGDPSLGMYTVLKNVVPDMPPFLNEFVEFKNGNLKVFVKKSQDNSDINVGLSVDAKIKPRRLDDLKVQPLDAAFDLAYTANPGQPSPKITVGANVNGTWDDPMGLTGYSLKNPSFRFGKTAEGTVIEIHTDRAEFKDGGETKAFVFDMDSTWLPSLPPVPSSLALQFAKSCKTKDKSETEIQTCKDTPLILTPVTLARLQKSIFDLAFKSGSNLSGQILKRLNGEAKATMEGFTNALSSAGDGAFSLIEKSPLSMIGVRDPVVYFGTPGSTPPRNDTANIEYPPLGLGLYVAGEFIIDTGGLQANLAEGKYMINLMDGYKVSGKVTPPSPFNQNSFDVSGNMPLLGGKQSLSFTGALDIPTMPIPTFPLTGTFDMTRGAFTSPDASIHANLSAGDSSIKDLTTIEGGMSLSGRNLSFSMSLGDCIPLEISADNIDLGSPETLAVKVAGSFRPSIPNPLDCSITLGKAILNMGEGAFNAGKSLVTDPLGSGKALVGGVGDLVTNPGEALENAGALAQMPVNMAEMGAGLGISLVKVGLEKVPVLGPGAAKAVGEAFDKASALKNEALGALASNTATRWLSDGIGESLGAVSGVASKALGTISDWGSSVFGGKKEKAPVWYRINPLRCKPGFHYWNDAFKQCFEYGSVVLFDDATRQGNSIGDCMRVKYRSDAPLTVGKCFGDATGQFHLDPSTDQITSSWYSYYGYNGGWYGPGRPECLTRGGGANGKVFLDSCHKNGDNSKWTYTEDMKLKNGNECMIRNADNEVVMGSCASANKWLGTSVVPNWNEVEDIPMRGQITHKSSGLCWYWEKSGPYKLKTCSTEDTSKRDDKIALRSHTNLRVLNDNHTVEIMGSRAWDGQVNYPCLGANANGNAFGNNACHPDTQDNKNKWQALAVKGDGTLDTGMNISLKDTLKGEYVFRNVSTRTCLYVDSTQANEEATNPLRFSGNCLTGNTVTNQARFTGYQPDNLSQWVRILAKEREDKAFLDAREQLKGNIQQWQRWRIRQENARIDQTFKALEHMSTDTKVARFNRKSPGHCAHGMFWNENLKRCSKDSKLMLFYNDANGNYKGCLRSEMVGTAASGLWPNCQTDQESDAFLDVISFIFDDQGRIIKLNKEYQVKTKTSVNKDGKKETFVVGTNTVTSKDTCLTPTNSYQRIEGKQRVNFMYCGDEPNQKWRYSPQGELVSHDGKCLREKTVTRTNGYNRANVRTRYRLDKEKVSELAARWKANPVPATRARNTSEYDAFQAQLGRDYPSYNLTTSSSYIVLDDCKNDPMQNNNRRWLPSIGHNFSAQQKLPETAQIKLASNNNLCVTGDMVLSGNITIQPCTNENKDQYFAFGGVNKTHFLISPRNSKTCIYDAGNNNISHGACRSNGSEMFLKIPQPNGLVKLQNASSGKCLSTGAATLAGVQDIVQMGCDTATAFKLDAVEQLNGLTFADVGELKINPEKSEQWGVINEKLKLRASLLYGGSYLNHGNNTLQKSSDDAALITPVTKTVTLEKLPSHVMPSGEIFYIPSIDVPETNIILLPGFEDGADHVTFTHGTSVQKLSDSSIIDIADPYASTYGNWFKFAHMQKVMHVADDQGNLKFDYIDESPEFRQAATFKMVPALSGQEGMYSFLSLSRSGQYLLQQGNKLIVGPANAAQGSFNLEGASKWMKRDDIDLTNPQPLLRKSQPYFKNWKFPDTPESVLNKDY